MSFSYFENVFSPMITAQVLITTTGNVITDEDGDLTSIYNGLPLRGGEKVSFKIPSNSENNVDLEFTEEQIRSEAQKLINVDSSGVIGSLKYYLSAISKIDYTEAIITILSIIIIYGFKRITTLVPSALVALIVITLGVTLIDIEYTAISKISAGIPKPNLEIFSISEVLSLAPYIILALLLSLLGAIDSLLTSLVADNMTKTRHNPNKELIGQGIGNSIAAIFGGLPGAGATIASFLAYGMERNVVSDEEKEKFGKGSVNGLSAPETANNAACSGSFVPMLTFCLLYTSDAADE